MKALALVLLLLATQEEETVAVTGVRIVSVTKPDVESGTIVIKGGKFGAVGADVKPPAGARIVDGKGLVAFPGMVHPYSRLGLSDQAGGQIGVTPHHLAVDEINPSLDVYAQAARSGVTTFVVQPTGQGVAGQAAALKPGSWTREELVKEKSAALRIVLTPGTPAKEALKAALDAAKKAIEGEKKSPPAKPEEKAGITARVLKGDLPAVVEVAGPGELLHFWQLLEPYAEFKPRLAFAGPPDLYKAAAQLGARKAAVILRPMVALAPFTRERINAAAELTKAGVEVALAPPLDTPEALQGTLFKVAELVKYGLPRDAALRALTLVPARIAGLEKRVGSIEPGKDADLLLFSADPLSPQARLLGVYIDGKSVYPGEPR